MEEEEEATEQQQAVWGAGLGGGIVRGGLLGFHNNSCPGRFWGGAVDRSANAQESSQKRGGG